MKSFDKIFYKNEIFLGKIVIHINHNVLKFENMMRFKFIFILLLTGIFIIETVDAQRTIDNNRSVNFGLKGGLNDITQIGEKSEDINSRKGYQLGLFISTNFLDEWNPALDNFSLRVELKYLRTESRVNDNNLNSVLFWGADLFRDEVRHGFQFDRDVGGPYIADEIFDENIYSTFTYQFIEVPFLINYSIPLENFTPYIYGGPSFSVLFDVDYSFTLNTEDRDSHTQTDIDETVKQHISKMNMGVDTGVGIRLPVGLFVETHYSFGFNDTLEFYNPKVQNRGFVANIGFQF